MSHNIPRMSAERKAYLRTILSDRYPNLTKEVFRELDAVERERDDATKELNKYKNILNLIEEFASLDDNLHHDDCEICKSWEFNKENLLAYLNAKFKDTLPSSST